MSPPHRPLTMPAPEDYFRGVSPLCRRILEDMSRVREKYGDKWEQLSYEEQCKILDQTIVDEATVRRYETPNLVGPDCKYFPKLKIPTGQKIVSDEKLSARGYTCSWRDEHSAPFSWHTRSQMDLTLDTPPETPVQTTSPSQHLTLGDNNELNKLNERRGNWNCAPSHVIKSTPFLWHYDPNPDLKPPDPPDLVLASLASNDKEKSSPYVLNGAQYNHIVIRTPGEGSSGFLGWFRGAISAITGSCIPMHSCTDTQREILHPSSPFIHPELRPPHVIAKGAKISLPTLAQPKKNKTESEESIFRLSKDATLKSECPSTETTFTNDVTSDRGSNTPLDLEGAKRDSQNINKSLLSNRNSLMYGTFAEENIDEEETSASKGLIVNENFPDSLVHKNLMAEMKSFHRKEEEMDDKSDFTSFSSPRNEVLNSDEDLPLINFTTNAQNDIPKTGFDFLDNW